MRIIGEGGGAGTSMRSVTAEGAGRVVRSLVGSVVVALTLGACTSSVGTLPRVAAAAPQEGYKMLRPGLAATECGAAIPWGAGEDDLLGRAFRRLLERDAEANLVINARVESTWWSIGVYGRRCVTLTGDLVRTTTTILLPMPASHGDHGGGHR